MIFSSPNARRARNSRSLARDGSAASECGTCSSEHEADTATGCDCANSARDPRARPQSVRHTFRPSTTPATMSVDAGRPDTSGTAPATQSTPIASTPLSARTSTAR